MFAWKSRIDEVRSSIVCDGMSHTTTSETLSDSISKVNSSQEVSVPCERSEVINRVSWRKYRPRVEEKGGKCVMRHAP